jgi:hypothetical protein
MTRSRIVVALAVCAGAALVGLGLAQLLARGPAPTGTPGPVSAAEAALTRRFLDENTKRYRASLGPARRWLDELDVDPLALRAQGIQGKKRLTELLDIYVWLHGIAPEAEKAGLVRRIAEVAAVTYESRYHDLLELDDEQFKQDSTAYLYAAYLMERVGLDTALYRREIRRIQPRLDAHLGSRGASQLMAFHWYYEHFGLAEPFPLAEGFRKGHIAARTRPDHFRNPMEIYNLTHEIFAPYRLGDALDGDFFSQQDRAYLRPTLIALSERTLEGGDVDLLSELLLCLRYLHFADLPVYREGIERVLSSQHPDGKWSDWEGYRDTYGDIVDVLLCLHTTSVAIRALSTAFHFREG